MTHSFEVSRALLRQALHRLAQEGVVPLHSSRGAQVPEPTRQAGAHVFDARRVLESEVARRLAAALDDGPTTELQRHVQAEARALRTGDRNEAIHPSGAFHRMRARMSGNPILVRMLDETLRTNSLRMALYKAPGEPMCVAPATTGCWHCAARPAAASAGPSRCRCKSPRRGWAHHAGVFAPMQWFLELFASLR